MYRKWWCEFDSWHVVLAVWGVLSFLVVSRAPAEHPARTFSSPAAPGRIVNPLAVSYADEPLPPGAAEAIPAPSVEQPGEQYYVSLALARHPRIGAARARVAAAMNRVPQARALEDPQLRNGFWPIEEAALQTADGRAVNELSVSQDFPWPQKRWTKAAIACREAQIAAANLAQVELEIEEAVKLAYFDLWFTDQAVRITIENQEIATQLVRLAEARHAAGGSQQDVLRAALQRDQLDDRLIDLRQQKAVAQADLAALILEPAAVEIQPAAELDLEAVPERIDALFAAALECSPRLRERQWAVSRDRQKQRLATLGRYPDLMLGTTWMSMTTDGAISPVATGGDSVSFMVGTTLPIWRGRINAAIQEASAEVAASARELDDARLDTYRQIRRLTEQAEAADEQLTLYEERILPRARQVLQLASADYRGQLVNFGEVADGFTEVLTFEFQVARTKATLAGTLAQLHRAIGCEVVLAPREAP